MNTKLRIFWVSSSSVASSSCCGSICETASREKSPGLPGSSRAALLKRADRGLARQLHAERPAGEQLEARDVAEPEPHLTEELVPRPRRGGGAENHVAADIGLGVVVQRRLPVDLEEADSESRAGVGPPVRIPQQEVVVHVEVHRDHGPVVPKSEVEVGHEGQARRDLAYHEMTAHHELIG